MTALDPQAEHDPDDKKYPELQVKATVLEVQVAALDPQAEQVFPLKKYPEEQVVGFNPVQVKALAGH